MAVIQVRAAGSLGWIHLGGFELPMHVCIEQCGVSWYPDLLILKSEIPVILLLNVVSVNRSFHPKEGVQMALT